MWIATRVTPQDDWENPVQLGPAVNSPAAARPRSVLASSPYPWAGGMALFFDCVRAGGCGGVDLWVTMRTAASDGWDQAVNLGPAVNSLYNDVGASMSADSSTLYFCSDRPNENGGWDLWEVRIGPPSDARDDEANESTNTHLVMDSPGIDGQ